MLHLEDFLELIENLPSELRDRFTEIRTLDLEVQNGLDVAEKSVTEHFKNAVNMSTEEKQFGFDQIKEHYEKILECADEKVNITTVMHDLVKRYLTKLDQEVAKFKIELEADNPGITEALEKKVKETEQMSRLPKRERIKKRKYGSPLVNGNAYADGSTFTANVPNGPYVDSHHRHVSIVAANNGLHPVASTSGKSGFFKKSQSVPNKLAETVRHSNTAAAASVGAAAYSNTQHISRDKVTSQATTSTGSGGAAAPFLHSFSEHAESRHGRPRKLTSRVSEMLRDVIHKQEQRERLGSAECTSAAAGGSGTSTPSGGEGAKPNTVGAAVTTNTSLANHHQRRSGTTDSDGDVAANDTAELSDQSDQQRWCICNRVSFGAMVACDDKDCPFEWFHYECVGITQPPKGKWFCPHCTKRRK